MNAIKGFFNFFRDIVKNRSILWGLAKNDLKSRYASSLLGSCWTFVHPLSTILVLWFVFQVGLRSADVGDAPFIMWFIPAFLSWNYFAETFTGVTGSLREYSYLVRKVNFRVSIIPLVKIISGAFVHMAFIVFIFVMNAYYQRPLRLENLQVFYYFFCMVVLLMGTGWLMAAITPFVNDVQSIVAVLVQVGFWATPITWNPDMMSGPIQMVLKLNPMYYVCRGYRDAFVDYVWFWDRGFTNIYFWCVTLVIFVLGAYTFKKLRPQFADVL